MTFSGWPAEALEFYEGLMADNSRTYWTVHKALYDEAVHAPMTALLTELEAEFGEGRIFRPYRSPPGSMPLMPGMLTAEQMDALRKARGAEFDHLFLTGMIQHHNGALIMVKDLFNTAGAGQDADIFNFATDADNTQRAEIKIMQGMLEKETGEKKTSEEKR